MKELLIGCCLEREDFLSLYEKAIDNQREDDAWAVHIRNTIGSGWVGGVCLLLVDTDTTTTSKFGATKKGGRFCCPEVSG